MPYMSKKTISVCITTFNRCERTIKSFISVVDDPRISEIIICDDCSEDLIFNELKSKINDLNNSKIKLFKNNKNKGAFLNKVESIKKCSNDWVALIDSDNEIDKSYIDNLPEDRDEKTFYLPSIAVCSSPNLNYSKYSGQSLGKNEFIGIIDSALANTGNYFFNKNTYLEAIEKEPNLINPYGLCSLYPLWLSYKHIDNFKIKVVGGLHYKHGLDPDSWFRANQNKSVQLINFFKNNI